jgi:CRISPR-associated protein Csd2
MCENFYDIRTFGAVMSTKENNCGQVRGPVQINFARSIDSIVPLEISITRMAVETEKESEKQSGDNRTMGRKHAVPYALYRTEGYISAHLSKQTGFSEDDLNLLWESLTNMFDHDHSAARGKMNARKLIVFKHDTALGNAPAHKLFDLVKVSRSNGNEGPARAFSDYKVQVNNSDVPDGVTLEEKF